MGSFIVLGLLSAIYLLINLGLPHFPVGTFAKAYVLQPLLWGLLILAIRLLPGYRPFAKITVKDTIIPTALGVAFIQVSIYAIGGLFFGFGRSPSSFTPVGIITNLVFVSSMLISMEMSRAWLITHLGKRHMFPALTFAALLYTFISIPLVQLTSFRLGIMSISLVASYWLPLLAENLLASQLALLVGARGSLAYRGLLAGFWWFSPILPDLGWSAKALIGVSVPIMGIAAVNHIYSAAQHGRDRPRWRHGNASFPTGWIVTAIASILLIWFAIGLFPLQPQLVGSGSMSPAMSAGDIVIVSKIAASEIKTGDVIQFSKLEDNEGISIIHRVINVQEAVGTRFFITKGDANRAPDTDPVNPQNLVGKVVFVVPKIGWLSIFAKNLFTR